MLNLLFKKNLLAFSAAKVYTYYIIAIEKRLIRLSKCCKETLPG